MTILIRSLAAALLAATATLASAAPGQPIHGSIVKGGKNPGGNMFERPTGSDGAAPLGAMTPGSYWVSVTAPGGAAPVRYAVAVLIGDRARAWRTVAVKPGADSERIVFDVREKSIVRVVVTEPAADGPVKAVDKAAVKALSPRL